MCSISTMNASAKMLLGTSCQRLVCPSSRRSFTFWHSIVRQQVASATSSNAKSDSLAQQAATSAPPKVGSRKAGEAVTTKKSATENISAEKASTEQSGSEKATTTSDQAPIIKRLTAKERAAKRRSEAKAKAREELAARKARKQELRNAWTEKQRSKKAIESAFEAQIKSQRDQSDLTTTLDRRAGRNEVDDDSGERFWSRFKFMVPSKEDKAQLNAITVEAGRGEQQESGPQSKFDDPTIPLGTGSGSFPYYLPFEKTKMIYPPSDVYPPPLPRLRDVDLDTAARALAVLRTSGVQWVEDKKRRDGENGSSLSTGHWRSVVRDADWLVVHSEMDRLDSEQCLEYLGDSLLHLLSRSALMMRFPRRTMNLYNVGANFLVSNDVFGHVYRDSGLAEERLIVAKQVQARNKAAELKRVKNAISTKEYEERVHAPLPEIILPQMHHLRQADLLEAYVGGIYLTLGFNEASKWCTRLFQPWLDRLARTPGFDAPRFLTPDGELHARLQQSMRNQVDEELRLRAEEEVRKLSMPRRWAFRLLERITGRRLRLASLDDDEEKKDDRKM